MGWKPTDAPRCSCVTRFP